MTIKPFDQRVFTKVPAVEIDLWRSTLSANGVNVAVFPEANGLSFTVIATPASGYDHFPTIQELHPAQTAGVDVVPAVTFPARTTKPLG